MKKKTILVGIGLGAALLIVMFGCAAPRLLWPQSDLAASEATEIADGKVVLVASRDSDFKRELVDKLAEELTSAGVNRKTIGVDDLKQVSTADYDVVVVISSAIAWGLDSDVQSFMKKNKDCKHIVLVVTSGDGEWLPDAKKYDVDAIATASTMTDVDAISSNTMESVNAHLAQ